MLGAYHGRALAPLSAEYKGIERFTLAWSKFALAQFLRQGRRIARITQRTHRLIHHGAAGSGADQLQELGAAMKKFRAGGKPIYEWLELRPFLTAPPTVTE